MPKNLNLAWIFRKNFFLRFVPTFETQVSNIEPWEQFIVLFWTKYSKYKEYEKYKACYDAF